ncbi:MAG TPA: type II secretion system F family protein [Streptosporangiaceae bacterium]|jgi:tight adherence protein B
MRRALRRASRLLLPGLLAAALAGGAASTASASLPPIGVPRVVMLLVDTHVTKPLLVQEQHSAVINYATGLPADVRIGMIIFSDGAQDVVPPTTNRAALNAELAVIRPSGSGSTGLGKALGIAASHIRRLRAASAGSRFVIFSDGAGLTGALPRPPVPADVVLWPRDRPDSNLPLLRGYAHANHGLAVSPSQVAELDKQVKPLGNGSPGAGGVNHYTPPPSPATAPATHPATQPAIQPAQPSASHAAPLPWALILAATAVFAVLFIVALVFLHLLAVRVAGRDLAGQLERYGPKRATPAVRDDEHGRLASAALDVVTRAMATTSAQRRLAQRLDLAAITRKPAEWVLMGICGSAVLAAVLSVATQLVLLGLLGGAVIGYATMRLTVSLRIARRRAAFSDQLPDLLQLIAGSLQSGFSLPQALDSIVREDTQPAAGEFARALAEARIGADLTDGLDSVADRMDSDDLRWTVMAIRIQRGVGGNLGEVLLTIASTIRERAYLRRQVRALSAEGRLSGYVLVALPLLVGSWLFISSGTYMRPLYTTPIGLLMLIGAGALVIVGSMWMRAMVRVEV